jgi:DNA-binding NarL/FixJ family response regulator
MIRVVIADDHRVVRVGLEQLLETFDDVEFLGAGSGGEEAVALCIEHRPDVLLLDLSMPDLDGIEVTKRLGDASPETRVVVFTSFSDRERIVQALDAGAVGYLLKDAEPDNVVGAVRAAARGESPLDPRAARVVLTSRSRPAPVSVLSGREKEVLVLVAEGLANKQIARVLGIAERTVKAHLTSIFNQIGVTDRTSAALWAHRRGLVGAPPETPPAR